MTFPEKSALTISAALIVVYGTYIAVIARWVSVTPVGDVVYQPLLVLATVPLAILVGLGHGVLAAVHPGAADAFDERDRQVAGTSGRVAGLVFAVGVFGAILLAMAEADHFYIAHTLLLTWVLAELADQLVKVVLYRRAS